jgi:hypothetical protein
MANLVGGTASVATTAILNTSMVFLTGNTGTVQGALHVSSRISQVNFNITSSNVGDNGDVAWMLINFG